MANGQSGRKLNQEQRQQVEQLLCDGLPVDVVAQRSGVSKSMVRIVHRDLQSDQTASELADTIWPDE